MATLPHLRLYRLGTATALILAPLLFLIDNLLHPEELTRGNELEQVAIVALARSRTGGQRAGSFCSGLWRLWSLTCCGRRA